MRKKRGKHNSHHHHHLDKGHNYNPKGRGDFGKKFIYWGLVYTFLFIILLLLFEKTKIFQAKIGFYIISGITLVLASRIIYSATNHKAFKLKGIIFWWLIYSISFGLIYFLLNKIEPLQNLNKYIFWVIFALVFTIIIIFLRKMKVESKGGVRRPKFLRAPSQILSGIILILAGILTFRFSYVIFVNWFNWAEGIAWSWLLGLILIIGGFLTIVAWWRNNVSMLTTKHNVNWNTHHH